MTESKHFISIARDFSPSPGLRYPWQGPYSGEEFRETVLKRKFEEAMAAGHQLRVSLDGIRGYGTSFLEESFGGLARELGIPKVQKWLVVECKDEPELIDDVATYVRDAEQRRRR